MKKGFLKIVVILLLAIGLVTSLFPSQIAQASPAKIAYVDVTSGKLNVRSGPGTQYKVIGSHKDNTRLTIYSQTKSGWSKIKYNKKNGYVATKYLRFYHTMSRTEAKNITDKAISLQNKIASNKAYTKKQIHQILSPTHTSAYIDKLIKYDMASYKKDKKGNKLYEWLATDFPAYRIWGFDWSGKEAPKKPSVTYYSKNGKWYLKVYQYHKDDMYTYHQTLYLSKSSSKAAWKIYNYKW
ncbi:SH3 domain-containing protein [Fictibacillus sp. B-59209]|uniref:SH3 domain-containing protein n=1 Tax=Fictibacillus sp. B-59209 TaxID=3024873 RepID=UPI002E201389|nr:SH3 domain-containing protein [Fictibacillus sp. B-59209]